MQFCQSTESPNWGHLSIFHKNREVKFPINTETNEIFNSDPPNLIRFKCLALAVHAPIVSIARAVYNLAKSIFVALQQNTPSFYKTIDEVPSALRYGVSLTKAAFLGIFSSLEKRRLYGELALVFQYTFVLASVMCNCLPCIPTPLPRKYLYMTTRNIGSFKALIKSITYVWNPLQKQLFSFLGRKEGFRVTHDIVYKPASGLCLGISLHFLAAYHKTNHMVAAAQIFQKGAPSRVVKTQALYDALLGMQGHTHHQDLNLQNPLVKKFILNSNNNISLRQFIFGDLEKQKIAITPDLYSLVLELDATLHHQLNPNERKYDSIHTTIIQVLAKLLGFKKVESKRIEEKCTYASELISNFDVGTYLIQFDNHTVALIKTCDFLAILDPSQGLTILEPQHQLEVLNDFLEYYGTFGFVSFNAIQLFKKKLIL